MHVKGLDTGDVKKKLQQLKPEWLHNAESQEQAITELPESLFMSPDVEKNTRMLVQQMVKYSEHTRWVGIYDYDYLLLLDIPRIYNTAGAPEMSDLITGYLWKEDVKSTETRLIPSERTHVKGTLCWLLNAVKERCQELEI